MPDTVSVNLQGGLESIDVTGADDVEIQIRRDGEVLWVNAPLCRLRICRIRGTITITDERR